MSDAPPIAVETAATADRRRLLIDLASSYALSVARVASMAAIIGLLYRYTDAVYAAAFVLCRSIVGMLNYVSAGIAPATLHAIYERRADERSIPVAEVVGEPDRGPLQYRDVVATASQRLVDPPATAYASASAVTLLMAFLATFVVSAYADRFDTLHAIESRHVWGVQQLVTLYGFGLLCRLVTEPASAVLQAKGALAIDNAILIAAEVAWPYLVWEFAWGIHNADTTFGVVAERFCLLSLLAAIARLFAARVALGIPRFALLAIDVRIAAKVARASTLTSIGSFADFLYAPFNLVLINAALGTGAVANYTPALQFDGALLLLVGAIAATILPRAMRLAGEHRNADLRTLYLRSTFVSLALLASAATVLWIASPAILRLWLGQPMPVTLSVLPFVLIHTVVGGTAGVGRATLLAMGRFRAYTISAVIGGVANVGLALLFVVGFGWGLRGVAMATIVAVVARCAIWMPWYVLRATR